MYHIASHKSNTHSSHPLSSPLRHSSFHSHSISHAIAITIAITITIKHTPRNPTSQHPYTQSHYTSKPHPLISNGYSPLLLPPSKNNRKKSKNSIPNPPPVTSQPHACYNHKHKPKHKLRFPNSQIPTIPPLPNQTPPNLILILIPIPNSISSTHPINQSPSRHKSHLPFLFSPLLSSPFLSFPFRSVQNPDHFRSLQIRGIDRGGARMRATRVYVNIAFPYHPSTHRSEHTKINLISQSQNFTDRKLHLDL